MAVSAGFYTLFTRNRAKLVEPINRSLNTCTWVKVHKYAGSHVHIHVSCSKAEERSVVGIKSAVFHEPRLGIGT